MTCIVGIECVDGAIIAGDYLGSNYFIKNVNVQPKVFAHSGMMFGYTTTFYFGQLIEFMLDNNKLYVPTNDDNVYSWLVRVFVPTLKTVLKEADVKGGNALMLINKQVWEIQDDFSVLRNSSGVAAVGSGMYHSHASIMTQIRMLGRQPTLKEAIPMLELAFDITSESVTSVSKKYTYLTQ